MSFNRHNTEHARKVRCAKEVLLLAEIQVRAAALTGLEDANPVFDHCLKDVIALLLGVLRRRQNSGGAVGLPTAPNSGTDLVVDFIDGVDDNLIAGDFSVVHAKRRVKSAAGRGNSQSGALGLLDVMKKTQEGEPLTAAERAFLQSIADGKKGAAHV
jgi:hypothetical protein